MRNRNIIINTGLMALALVGTALAAPIPLNLTGLDKPVSVISPAQAIGTGGSFNARVGNPLLNPGFSTTFWCVDIEYFISPGASSATYDANIILVANTTAQASFVQKGTVNAWEDGNNNYSAQQRYNAAGYLIEMIQANNSGFDPLDIQHAIWRLTDAAPTSNTDASWQTNGAYLAAQSFITSGGSTAKTWATVSGVAGAAGALDPINTRQTFLVEVANAPVPEPGTYALMGGGLLIFAGLRRRRSN